ncbi:ATP-dependent DNA helicase [Corynebacterium uropygiale]|uniref:ATP-dependent helicase DinG n=1 Tax=Corynebacterium uropygiale TaxID=1775911 RepID=A0A9X1QRI4_9CORY|nr:ATP-dependent DNA helicase [Corynebacterium uropygiale]
MTDSLTDTGTLLAAAVEALGGAPRLGQQKMADAVSSAMERERHLAVQAGTGTGKSLAYLVPALRHAQATGSTVIVSTATIALQNQLVQRDLPRLVEALEPHLERRPTFAIMKGRSNYVCLHRLSAGPEAEPEGGLFEQEELTWMGKQVARVREWAQETETGDRDDLDPGVPDMAWKSVSVTARECVGAKTCPHGEECFAERARPEAREVDVVVTNHALLAIDALADMSILPEHDVVIVDEAHELDGRITSVATASLSSTMVRMVARRAKKLGAEGADATVEEAAQSLEEALLRQEPGRWTDLPEEARDELVGLRDELFALRQKVGRGPEGEAASDPEKAAERHNVASHLMELHDSVVRMLEVFDESDPAKQADVVWLVHDERRGTATLHVAPLSVAGLLHSRLFAENTVILTSATLTVGGNFRAMAAAWGLPRGMWDSLDVGYPFDPARSGILYVARHLPAPGRDGLAPATLDEIAELITAAGGRTLGLFSSRRAAQQAAEAMRNRLPFDILLQGDESTGTLVRRFAASENVCLFGTLSLWQGVDVPGRSLSLVIIDRIPFPRPDDPLLQARKEAADAEGRNGFMEVSATHAALLLAQGAGRLLRRIDDRGVVAVLDNRLVTRRYGEFFCSSMPAFWRTTDPSTVRGALRRLVAAPKASKDQR